MDPVLRFEQVSHAYGPVAVFDDLSFSLARGQIGCLLIAVDGREHQLDRPLGGQAFGLQRVGQAQAAHGEVWPFGAAAVQLALHVLAFAQLGAGRQPGQLLRLVLAVQVGRAHLGQPHAQLA